MDGGHSESNRGSFFQRARSWLKYRGSFFQRACSWLKCRGSFFQRACSRWGYRGSFFQKLYCPAAGARMRKDSGGANECPPLMEESGGRSLFYFSSLSDFCFFSLFSLITTATMRHTNQTTTQMIIMMMRSLTEELIVCLFFIVVMYAFLSIVSKLDFQPPLLYGAYSVSDAGVD